tara:strand:- start:795 stop:896 length:102 start_codon:yes stop_codon:yes gene_type:complete
MIKAILEDDRKTQESIEAEKWEYDQREPVDNGR